MPCPPGPGRRATAASDRDIRRSMILEHRAHKTAARSFILFLHCHFLVITGPLSSVYLNHRCWGKADVPRLADLGYFQVNP